MDITDIFQQRSGNALRPLLRSSPNIVAAASMVPACPYLWKNENVKAPVAATNKAVVSLPSAVLLKQGFLFTCSQHKFHHRKMINKKGTSLEVWFSDWQEVPTIICILLSWHNRGFWLFFLPVSVANCSSQAARCPNPLCGTVRYERSNSLSACPSPQLMKHF